MRYLDAPFYSRYQSPFAMPDRRGSTIARCIDSEPPRDLIYRGQIVVASAHIPDFEPAEYMTLKLDSRRDVSVCVRKAGPPIVEFDGRWYVGPKTYAEMRKLAEGKA